MKEEKSYYEVIKDIIRSLRYKPEIDQELIKDHKTMPWSIYHKGLDEKASTMSKRWIFAHGFLKYTLLMPGLYIIDKLFSKRLIKDIPDFWYNKNFQIMDVAFENTVLNSERYYQAYKNISDKKPQKKISASRMKRLINSRHYNLLRRFKNIFFTIVLMDSFYRNFFDEYAIQLANSIHEEYDGKQKINHIKYTGKSMINMDYYIIGEIIRTGERNVTLNINKVKTDEELDAESNTTTSR